MPDLYNLAVSTIEQQTWLAGLRENATGHDEDLFDRADHWYVSYFNLFLRLSDAGVRKIGPPKITKTLDQKDDD